METALGYDAADRLRARLELVLDPELGASIVELGMVGEILVVDGHARVEVNLTTSGCPLRVQIERDVLEAARSVSGVATTELVLGILEAGAKAELMKTARRLAQERSPLTSIARGVPVVQVASGKGGVGKSSITANLAVALAGRGLNVGVLDADIWGFSLSRLLGMHGEVQAKGGKMQPLVRQMGQGSIRLLSMGMLADEDQALLWRGLMVSKAVAQFIEDANWSEVDYMLIDTPPGTGDIAMTLAKMLPQTGQLLVTTPGAEWKIAARAGDLARKSNIRVLGVVENMSALACACGRRHELFGSGGGQALADWLGVELLASIPLMDAVHQGGDAQAPFVLGEGPDGVMHQLARRLVSDVYPPGGQDGCTARLLERMEELVANV
jgi:ATP-binding protein involved in chromosome partitioning